MINFSIGKRDEIMSGKKKQTAYIASSNVSIASSTGNTSVTSAASFRSRGSSLSTASNTLSLNRDTKSRNNLPLPCHLNCRCEDCRTPNSHLLDNLLNMGPIVPSGTATSHSAVRWASLGDDDIEF